MEILVESIKKIGIFMIAAQAVIHFAPSQKYEKYIKLIVGMMILVQFVVPFHRMNGDSGVDWKAVWEGSESGTDMGVWTAEETFVQLNLGNIQQDNRKRQILEQMGDEIKSKLNNFISKEGYLVTNVTVSISGINSSEENYGTEANYELDSVKIEMQETESGKNETVQENHIQPDSAQIDKVQIEPVQVDTVLLGKISTDKGDEEHKNLGEKEEQEEAEAIFRQRFSEILGISEEVMEVIVYGADKEADG